MPFAEVNKPAGLVTAFLCAGKEACRQAAAMAAGWVKGLHVCVR